MEEEIAQDNVPSVTLTDADGDGVYEASYNFTETGQYRVVVYATDTASLTGPILWPTIGRPR